MATEVIMAETVLFAGELWNKICLDGGSPTPELYNLANVGNVLPVKTTKEGYKYFILSEDGTNNGTGNIEST
jgi:hypothetical protein